MMEKKRDLISVVVPVYNGEKYLEKLYDCLANQTYENLEVIFVDDFSTDQSYELLQQFTKNDNRFSVIKMKKKGGTAVKGQEYALPFCHGDYYFFLSQDDFIDDDLFEKCLSKAISTSADIVLPNMVLYYEGKSIVKEGKYPLENNYCQELNSKEAFLLSLHWEIHGFAFIKMDLVKQIGIRAEYYNSCEFYMRKCYLFANKIAFCDTNFYYRQDNSEAITKSIKYFHIDVLTTDYLLYVLLKNNGFEEPVVKKRMDELVYSCKVWHDIIKKIGFNKTEKRYMYNALIKVRMKLLIDQIFFKSKSVWTKK